MNKILKYKLNKNISNIIQLYLLPHHFTISTIKTECLSKLYTNTTWLRYGLNMYWRYGKITFNKYFQMWGIQNVII